MQGTIPRSNFPNQPTRQDRLRQAHLIELRARVGEVRIYLYPDSTKTSPIHETKAKIEIRLDSKIEDFRGEMKAAIEKSLSPFIVAAFIAQSTTLLALILKCTSDDGFLNLQKSILAALIATASIPLAGIFIGAFKGGAMGYESAVEFTSKGEQSFMKRVQLRSHSIREGALNGALKGALVGIACIPPRLGNCFTIDKESRRPEALRQIVLL